MSSACAGAPPASAVSRAEVLLAAAPAAPARAPPAPFQERDGRCVLRADAIPRPLELLLERDGRPFAEVTRARSVTMHLGTDGALTVEIDAGGVLLTGLLGADEAPIFASAPVVLGGAVIPMGWVGLRYVGLESEGARVALAPSAVPAAISGFEAPLSGVARCDALSVLEQPLSLADVAPKRGKTATLVGEAVLLSVERGAEPALTLWPTEDAPAVVHVLERAGGAARVAWSVEDVVVVGWVDEAELGPPRAAPDVSPRRASAMTTRTVRAPSRFVCPHAVPVVAEVGGASRFSGRVEPGSVLGVELDGDVGFLLSVEGAGFQPYSYSELRVRPSDLVGCRPR